jgi:hypothetical protein
LSQIANRGGCPMVSMQTVEGKRAYELGGQIAETRATHRRNEVMDLYGSAASPAAQVEVLKIAASLADASGIL